MATCLYLNYCQVIFYKYRVISSVVQMSLRSDMPVPSRHITHSPWSSRVAVSPLTQPAGIPWVLHCADYSSQVSEGC